jgi:hypothetical protein
MTQQGEEGKVMRENGKMQNLKVKKIQGIE